MRVIDNFLGRTGVVDTVANSFHTLPENTSWWSGWWGELGTVGIDDFWKHIIYEIWKEYPNVEQAQGFEYWGNTLDGSTNKELGIHKDKDEAIFERTGAIVTPDFGAVYYPSPQSYDGGYLEIYNDDDFEKTERLAPCQDRLIMFNPSHYHRVTPVYGGVRKTFVVNLWMHDLPEVATTNA